MSVQLLANPAPARRPLIPDHNRIGLSRAEAAEYVGVGVTLFDQMVGDGRMPKPKLINSRKVWHRQQLDAAFAALPEEGQTPSPLSPWSDLSVG
jgi:predicted DNA-binding transcriptional regulator AlpA